MKKFLAAILSPEAHDYSNNTGYVFKRTMSWIILLTIIISLSLLFLKCNNTITALVTFLSVAGASFAGGSAIGFLFGLPRAENYRFVKKEDFEHGASSFAYSDNTNLEEVSDWLSKIIVGLTLIKIRTIISWIDQSARSIQHTFHMCKGDSSNFYVFGYGIIILYFLAGGGVIYLWARTNPGRILTDSRKKQAEMQKGQQAIASLQAIANPEMNINNDGRMVQINEALGEEAKKYPTEDFKNKIESIYNAKPVVDKTDIQNGRWGGVAQTVDKAFEATYDPVTSFNGIYKIILKVRSTNSEKPLTGQVAFFLHDTFPSQIIYTVVINNLAQISFMAYEAFVAGVRLEDGTELELNLNTVNGLPNDFYWKD